MPYDTQQQALAVAFSLGCPVGAHKKGDKWMPCRTDAAYEAAKAKKKGLKKMEGQKNMGRCSMCGEDIADEAQAFQAEGGQAMCQDCFMGMPDTEEEAEDAMEPEEEPEDMGKAQQRVPAGHSGGGQFAGSGGVGGEHGGEKLSVGDQVMITGNVRDKGAIGVISEISPRGTHVGVANAATGRHVGYFSLSDVTSHGYRSPSKTKDRLAHFVGATTKGPTNGSGSRIGKSDDDLQVATEFIKVDESLGLVFGFAVVCKVDGEDYFDLQGDHIPESAMVEAAADFMLNSRAGKEMHKGDANCQAVFAMPLTEEIAKAFGLGTPKMTGLMIAIKPIGDNAADVLAKVRSGEYRGFSIGGKWLKSRSVEPVPE